MHNIFQTQIHITFLLVMNSKKGGSVEYLKAYVTISSYNMVHGLLSFRVCEGNYLS